MQKENDRLIIAVSNHKYSDYTTISNILGLKEEQLLFYYTDGNESKSSLDDNFSYNFAFIDQRGQYNFVDQGAQHNKEYSDLADKIEEVINETKAFSIRIAVHNKGDHVSKVQNGINRSCNDKKVISVREFIHESVCEIWEDGLEPFINNSIGGGFDSYDEYYETLWKLLAPKPSGNTQTSNQTKQNIALEIIRFFRHDIDNVVNTVKIVYRLEREGSIGTQKEHWNSVKKSFFMDKELIDKNLKYFESIQGSINEQLTKNVIVSILKNLSCADNKYNVLLKHFDIYSDNKENIISDAEYIIDLLNKSIKMLETVKV